MNTKVGGGHIMYVGAAPFRMQNSKSKKMASDEIDADSRLALISNRLTHR